MVRSLRTQQTICGVQGAVLFTQQIRIRMQRMLQIGRPGLFTSDVKENVRHAFFPWLKESSQRLASSSAWRKDNVSLDES
jgi:hypothetical protein